MSVIYAYKPNPRFETSLEFSTNIEKLVTTTVTLETGITLPEIDLSLTVKTGSMEKIELFWSGSTQPSVVYVLERTQGLNVINIEDFAVEDLGYVDTDVEPGKTYIYTIKSDSGSVFSNIVIATVPYAPVKPYVESMFFIEETSNATERDINKKRYDLSKFIKYDEEKKAHNALTSYLLNSLKGLRKAGEVLVKDENHPEWISNRLYRDTMYWWMLLNYNDTYSNEDVKFGESFKYFNNSNLESIYFKLKKYKTTYNQKMEIEG